MLKEKELGQKKIAFPNAFLLSLSISFLLSQCLSCFLTPFLPPHKPYLVFKVNAAQKKFELKYKFRKWKELIVWDPNFLSK